MAIVVKCGFVYVDPVTRSWIILLPLCALLLAGGGCAGRGRAVFIREGCVNCHRFRDLGGGGAPDLTDVGARRDAAWIRTQITDPAGNNPNARMPAFGRIRGVDLVSLVAFLRG